jgi:hypothetical protein
MDAAMAAQQLSGASQILNTTLMKQVGTANAAAAAIANLTKAYSSMAATQAAAGNLPTFGIAGAAGAAAREGKTVGVNVRRLRRNIGGGVPGSGNTDTVPAMLTPGEFVINKEATKQNLGLLKAINDGKTQGLNKGGIANGVQYLNRGAIVSQARSILDIVKRGGMGSLDDFVNSVKDPKVASLLTRYGSISRAGSGKSISTGSSSKTFAHMDANTMNAKTPEGKQFFDNLYETLLNSGALVGHQKATWAYGKANGWNGWRVTGGTGFNLSKQTSVNGNSFSINSRLNTKEGVPANVLLDDLIQNFSKGGRDNPYLPMLRRAGIKDNALIEKVSQKIHNDVIKNLSDLGQKTITDQKIYPDMTKIIRDSIGSTVKDSQLKEKALSNLSAGLQVRTGNVPKLKDPNELKGTQYSFQALLKRAKESGTDISDFMPFFLQRNKGGKIPGSGNSDTVPTMLTPGEFVVNKKAASQNQGILEMMNGGQVKGYALGGLVAGATRLASSRTGKFIGGTAASLGGYEAGSALTGGSMFGGLAGSIITPMLPKAAAVLAGAMGVSTAALVGVTAPLALAGFAIYKLNQSLNEAQKSGAKLSEAMYGSAEKTKAMGEAFGRESYAETSRKMAVESAGGQEITQEAQAASGEFMKTDAATQMIKDLEIVKKSGEDVALSLRNQLASSIIAGVISPEEAKAIAIDMGKELKDQKLAVNVAGQLSSLLGPNGEKLLTDPAGIVVAITPQIDKNRIKNDAQSAYDELNPLQAFGQLFKGGKEEFVKNFSIETISSQNASALAKEAEARAMLNVQVKEGTITLEQYIKAVGSLGEASTSSQKAVADANAQALGFSDVAAMNSAANRMSDRQKQLDTNTGANGQTLTAEQRSQLLTEGSQDISGQQALESANKIKEQLRTILKTSGYEDAAAQSIISGVENGLADGRVGDAAGLFAKVISGELRTEDIDIVARLKLEGNLDSAGVDDLIAKIDILRTVPDIDTKFNFNSVNTGEDINEIMSLYDQLQKNPDITKKMFAEDKFTSVFKQFGINYNMIAALPDLEQAIVTKNIETYVKYEASIVKDRKTDPSEVARDLRILDSTLGKNIRSTLGPKSGVDKPQDFSGMSPSGSGKGNDEKNKLADLKKMLMERFRLQEMFIDKEAEGFNNRIKQINREIELEERQVSLRQRSLSQLSKKEEGVNKAYDLRVEALDKVSESNSRITEQEKSRISLASALASGDIAAAATISGEMQQQSAQYQIEDARAALEKQRQTDLESLTVSINGKLMTRKDIEFEMESIQDRIYEKGQLVQGLQDQLLILEDKKLAVAKEREKVETRMYLLEQQKAIQDLRAQAKKKKGKGLTAEEKKELEEYRASYNQVVDMYNASNPGSQIARLNYGGSVARMANGGIAYRGSTEAPPAIRMAFGSTVPGRGMTDKVPALLTPGEFVVRKSVADKNRSMLQALNGQVFPGLAKTKNAQNPSLLNNISSRIPKNNFLDGIASPTYSVPKTGAASVPAPSTNVVAPSSTMYNSTYNVNVNVSGTNASPDDIANVVMAKLSQQNRGNLRSSRY